MAADQQRQVNERLEYDLIHRVRMDWNNYMMRWRNIAVPLALTLIGIMAGLSDSEKPNLWFIGWFLGILLLFYWRFIERHIDMNICGLYRRIVTLEQQLGMTFYSHYLWLSLRNRGHVPQDKDGNFNYQGIISNLKSIGSRGHLLHNVFLTIYYVLGVITFYSLLFSGHYERSCWITSLANVITLVLLGIVTWLWIPPKIRWEDM